MNPSQDCQNQDCQNQDCQNAESEGVLTTAEQRQPVVLEQNIDREEVVFTLQIPEHNAAFNGHFPGSPVLPGVVQIEWAKHFVSQLPREFPPIRGEVLDIERLKFMRLILPGTTVYLRLKPAKQTQAPTNATPAQHGTITKVDFEFFDATGSFSNGRLVFVHNG